MQFGQLPMQCKKITSILGEGSELALSGGVRPEDGASLQ